MTVKFYDVGQGLAALVTLPDGRRVLVDTGEQPKRAGCGPACRRWSSHLLEGLAADVGAGKSIDLLWITHQHSDHNGNAETILQSYAVGVYTDNGTRNGNRRVQSIRETARARGARVWVSEPGRDNSPLPATAEVSIQPIVPERWPVKCDKHPNDCSIGLRVNYCSSSVLFTGDAEEHEEVALPVQKPATLLQVGHHGSLTSSSAEFLDRVQPEYAVISSGKVNEGTNRTYCHPRRETVEALTKRLGGVGTKTMRVFQGTSCREQSPGDWVEVPVSDRLFATARDGDVVLTTTGDGRFH